MSMILSRSPYIEAVPAENDTVWRVWYTQSGCFPTEERLDDLKGYIENLSGGRILLDTSWGYNGLLNLYVSPLSMREQDEVSTYLRLVAIVLQASCADSALYRPDADILQILVDRNFTPAPAT